MTQHTTTTGHTVSGSSVSRFGVVADLSAKSSRTTVFHGYARYVVDTKIGAI